LIFYQIVYREKRKKGTRKRDLVKNQIFIYVLLLFFTFDGEKNLSLHY